MTRAESLFLAEAADESENSDALLQDIINYNLGRLNDFSGGQAYMVFLQVRTLCAALHEKQKREEAGVWNPLKVVK